MRVQGMHWTQGPTMSPTNPINSALLLCATGMDKHSLCQWEPRVVAKDQ